MATKRTKYKVTWKGAKQEYRFTIKTPGGKPRTRYTNSISDVDKWDKMVRKHRKNGGSDTASISKLKASTNRYVKTKRIGWRKGKISKK